MLAELLYLPNNVIFGLQLELGVDTELLFDLLLYTAHHSPNTPCYP